MAYPVPKIVWGSGGPNTLAFAFPPTQQPGASLAAEREDSVATGGAKQSMLVRIDELFPLHVELVPEGSSASLGQLGAWRDFMENCALRGQEFDYYPDAAQGVFHACTLEDKDWRPELQHRGPTRYFRFDITLRRRVS